MKLTIELVPSTSWGSNLRSALSTKDWDTLRKECYAKSNHVCEICGGKGRKHPVEAHEVWSYDDSQQIQTLVRLIALCPSCHECKHIGRALSVGNGPQAVQHFAKVNSFTLKEAELRVLGELKLWKQRSQHPWTLDLTWLDSYGIKRKS